MSFLLPFFFFGDWVGDGKHKIKKNKKAMMVFGALAQGLSFGSSPEGVIATLCIWRVFLGVGIGGD
jgi:PHS family inorganic phosphate transporter-like MFS transporter